MKNINIKKVLIVFGTRPEAIKMCPLVKEREQRANIETVVCVTGQHRHMLDQVLNAFGVEPAYDLGIMRTSQTLYDITTDSLKGMKGVLEKVRPDLVLVHGDTTTTFSAALASYYMQILVGHVEAGLRTHNIYSPYPEEFNRQGVGIISSFHFAPTVTSKDNLIKGGKAPENNVITRIKEYEREHNVRFASLTIHDSEDVIHTYELLTTNYLIDKHDALQFPVFPILKMPTFRNFFSQLTTATYADEFAENHFTTLVQRDITGAFVPCVGTGFAIYYMSLVVVGITIIRQIGRGYALYHVYGMRSVFFGCLLPPLFPIRLIYGNIINFTATVRAIRMKLFGDKSANKKVKREHAQKVKKEKKIVKWAKTDHDFLTRDQLRQYRRMLGDMLIVQGYITAESFRDALKQVKHEDGEPVGAYLIRKGIISEEQMIRALGHVKHIIFIPDYVAEKIDCSDILAKYDVNRLREDRILPLYEEDGTLIVGICNATSDESLRRFEQKILICTYAGILEQPEAKIKEYMGLVA